MKVDRFIDFVAVFLIALLLFFFCRRWYLLEHPPLRTLGETRMLYALLLISMGFIIRFYLKDIWPLLASLLLGSVFIILNIVHPEKLDQELMPALRSPWFIPHVVSYIQGYALLAIATLLSFSVRQKSSSSSSPLSSVTDRLVALGFMFISFGMFSGAYWAKEAWGTYWSWDPKETWALLSWLSYVVYFHFIPILTKRSRNPYGRAIFLTGNFMFVLICWFGVNYLPSAALSVHVYTN